MPNCCDCNKSLSKAQFSKNQLRKDPSSRRCKACVQLLTLHEEEDPAMELRHEDSTADPAGVTVLDIPKESFAIHQEKEIEHQHQHQQQKEEEEDANKIISESEEPLNSSVEVMSKPDDVSSCTDHSFLPMVPKKEILGQEQEQEEEAVPSITATQVKVRQDSTLTLHDLDMSVDKMNAKQIPAVGQPNCVGELDLSHNNGEAFASVSEEKKEKDMAVSEAGSGSGSGSEIPNLVSVPSITIVDAPCYDESPVRLEEEVVLSQVNKVVVEKVPGLKNDDPPKQVEKEGRSNTDTMTGCNVTTCGDENSTDPSASTRVRVGICAMDKKARSKPMVSELAWSCV